MPYSHLAQDPWPELDREEKFATDHPDPDEIDHRGGRVHFYATLKKPTTTTTKDIYKIELNPARLGASNSFSRRFGSKSFLHLKIPTPLLYQQGSDMTSYLRKPLILCQHVFRAFYAKEQTVYYFRTNEVWNAEVQLISPPSSSSSGIGFLDFIKWHNPIELNYQQVLWSASSISSTNTLPRQWLNGLLVLLSDYHPLFMALPSAKEK